MNLFTPKPVIDNDGRRWIHSNFDWFSKTFDCNDISKIKMILPTKDFFPFNFDGSMQSVQNVIDVLCEHFGIDKNLILLKGLDLP
jgi:hypothetical protein